MIIKHQAILNSLYQDFVNERRFLKRYKDEIIRVSELTRYQRTDFNTILNNIDLILTKIEILKSSFPADPVDPPFDDLSMMIDDDLEPPF